MTPKPSDKILVIKLSALGDFVQALGVMKAIRAHHGAAHITLMTTKSFAELGRRCGYFDEIIIDKRPKMFDLKGWLSLRKTLNTGRYTRVYDLQNNDRSCFYFRLFSPKPEWVGTAHGASHQNTSPERTAGLAFEGHVQTLGLAGVKNIEIDDLSWVEEDLSAFPLRAPYVLLVPGCAPQHPYKRWPAAFYGDIANRLFAQGLQPVLIGTGAEKEVLDQINEICPQALNLCGQTTLFQVAALTKNASAALGNDTGPMHMIAPTGCASIILFSGHSKPDRHAPRGKSVSVLQSRDIADISTDQVWNALSNAIKAKKRA